VIGSQSKIVIPSIINVRNAAILNRMTQFGNLLIVNKSSIVNLQSSMDSGSTMPA